MVETVFPSAISLGLLVMSDDFLSALGFESRTVGTFKPFSLDIFVFEDF